MSARRDAALFLAAALVPAGATGLLGWRALRNEEAALRREAALEVSVAADALGAELERRLAAGARDLAALPVDAALGGPEAELEAYERTRAITPPFAAPFVLAPDGTLLLPRAEGRADPQRTEACDAAVRGLSGPERVASREAIFSGCEDARDARGRWVWPVLAVLELRSQATPGLGSRLAAWLESHASQMRPEERAVTREEVASLALDASMKRRMTEALAASSPTSSGIAPTLARALRADAVREALARPEEDRAVPVAFEGPGVAGALRGLGGGGHVGFVVTHETLGPALSAPGRGWTGLSPELVASATTAPLDPASPTEAPRAVTWVADGLGVTVSHADPRRLSAKTSRSERVLIGLIAFGIAIALGLAWLLYRRMLATRRTSELRTSFVAGISHELRTPLASVRMLSELLAEGRVDDEAERTEIAEALAREAKRMSETVERFLAYAKSERGKLVAKKDSIDLAAVARARVAAFVERHPDAKVEVAAPDALEVPADRPQLEIVVDNLLENALKYAPEGQPYKVVVSAAERVATLSVADDGPGIAAAQRRRVFEAFERGDDRLSKATSGTGLGLFLVRTIARAHGGEVALHGERARGATFVVSLPLADERG
ncbi:MAG: HAMP domain-containing histidine kinase [Polyangiaceae bacterium]|nr:HAMP domain-containing histidine kinase [Polyangiaceae bacterium]